MTRSIAATSLLSAILILSFGACGPMVTDSPMMLGTHPPPSGGPAASLSSPPDVIVNTTGDVDDFFGGRQVGDLPGSDGLVSLREAIIATNNTPGAQIIGFNIPTTDAGFDGTVFTIQPLSPFPSLTDGGTTINGATQTAFTGPTNPAGPTIDLDGSAIALSATGITLLSANNVIHALVIRGFSGTTPTTCCGTGIRIDGNGATGNIVTGCFIGTDASGTVAAGNGTGLVFGHSGSNNRIGGATPGERNIISGNVVAGLSVRGSDGNSVEGNFIGTDVSGTMGIGNGRQAGIQVQGDNNRIVGNLVSANVSGISIGAFSSDPNITSASYNVVQGNLIGTDVHGNPVLGNGLRGVIVGGAIPGGTSPAGNRIGGMLSGQGNLIAGNGVANTPTGATGVALRGTVNTVIEGNVISQNLGVGIGITNFDAFVSLNNTLSRNQIVGNGALGIDIFPNGVNANDPGDADAGQNNRMNFPVLIAAKATPGRLVVKGTIDTPNPSTVVIELFANPVPTPGGDPSGYGEGALFLGTATPNPLGDFTATFPPVVVGTLISATATDAAGNTSEFAANAEARNMLTGFAPAQIWLGLKNSDDVGTKFDVLAEVLKNGAVVGSGQVNGVAGGSSGFNNAILREIAVPFAAPVPMVSGDVVGFRVSVRIAATGHRSGTARLWYNDASAKSQFEGNEFYLISGASGLELKQDAPGAGPRRSVDVRVDRAVGGNPFKTFGTWSIVLP
ncbi:MAG TPA: right-handed parallel beta-helix repeat-containing protein [Gemmatimonadaceae bacterium]